jgi:hypothetical protein
MSKMAGERMPVLNRDARVLLAWMSEPQARLTLLGGRMTSCLLSRRRRSPARAAHWQRVLAELIRMI